MTQERGEFNKVSLVFTPGHSPRHCKLYQLVCKTAGNLGTKKKRSLYCNTLIREVSLPAVVMSTSILDITKCIRNDNKHQNDKCDVDETTECLMLLMPTLFNKVMRGYK